MIPVMSPARIESARREHVGQLLAERSLILSERSAEQLERPDTSGVRCL
jgi:hypothetical protein